MNIFKTILKLGLALLITLALFVMSCKTENKPREQVIEKETQESPQIEGTWKMTYAEIRENDSVQVKDLSSTDFIKILNKSHFAFFNQERETNENFTAGAGTYTFDGSTYVENLNFINYMDYRGHSFSFEVQIQGDTLIQQGHEKIEDSGVDRYILEKYVRVQN